MKNSLTDIGSRKREDTLKQRDDKLEDPPSQSRNAPRGVKYKVGNETYIRSIRIYEELGAALDGIAPSGQCVGRALRSSHLWPGHRVERERAVKAARTIAAREERSRRRATSRGNISGTAQRKSAGKADDEARAHGLERGNAAGERRLENQPNGALTTPLHTGGNSRLSAAPDDALVRTTRGHLRYEIRIWSEVEARLQHALLACSACARLCSKVLPSLCMAHALGRNLRTD